LLVDNRDLNLKKTVPLAAFKIEGTMNFLVCREWKEKKETNTKIYLFGTCFLN